LTVGGNEEEAGDGELVGHGVAGKVGKGMWAVLAADATPLSLRYEGYGW